MLFVHSAVVLCFGVFLSLSFSGIKLNRVNICRTTVFCLLCSLLHLGTYLLLSEKVVWWLYPVIAHLPTVLYMILGYRKNPFAATVSVLSAYLLCQPAKWVGVLTFYLTQSSNAEYTARIICLLTVGAFALKFASPCLRGIFNKDIRSVCIFGIIPTVYYLFDYITVVYTGFWLEYNPVVAEFLPLFLCIAFLIFCMVYYREYEQKADAERKEQIMRIVSQQQAEQIEKVKQVEQEQRVIRHDMQHFLTRLAFCIDNGETAKAKEMLQGYITYIDGTQLQHFCQCDTINCVLSAFTARCAQENINLRCDIQLNELKHDELLFCSILQNALDNAYNAQLILAPEQRNIQLLLKTLDDKLLLSIKNPILNPPVFSDGVPVSTKPGHGYGTQSICYLSARLGGSCQFSVQGNLFILRVVL